MPGQRVVSSFLVTERNETERTERERTSSLCRALLVHGDFSWTYGNLKQVSYGRGRERGYLAGVTHYVEQKQYTYTRFSFEERR